MSTQDPAHPFGTCGSAQSEHETHPDPIVEQMARVAAAYEHLALVTRVWAAAK